MSEQLQYPENMHLSYRRKIVPKDIPAIRDIVESSGFFSPEEVEIAIELGDERLTRGEKSGYHFLLAEIEKRVIGYACFGPIMGTLWSFDLYWIAVHEDYRGKGIGKGLIEETESVISAMKGRRIYVETSSRRQYDPTRQFYRVCGYKEEAVLQDFYAPGDSKIIFCKVIL